MGKNMLRQQTATPLVMPGPLLLALLGAAFCVWSASGNALNLCVTTGCSLFQDFTVGGMSMWWIGAAGFAVLALLSLSGRPLLGVVCSGVGVLVDVLLLALMLTTSPCVGCLFAALLFALLYLAFRQCNHHRDTPMPRSWLLLLWSLLFIANVGAVVKAEAETWPMYGPENAATRVYFSPSCSACREAVNSLSGRVNVAFYPLAENAQDIPSIETMIVALAKGDSMAEALAQAVAEKTPSETSSESAFSPSRWLLQYRVLRNKAHVLASGAETVPYIEFHGLPGFLSSSAKSGGRTARPVGSSGPSGTSAPMTPVQEGTAPQSTDATLPVDTGIAGSCGGATNVPCP